MREIPVAMAIPYRNLDGTGVEIGFQQRVEDGPLNGLWEFPGGKIQVDETPRAAAKREFLEEVGDDFDERDFRKLSVFPYTYSDRRVVLFVHYLEAEHTFMPLWKRFDFNNADLDFYAVVPDANRTIIEFFMSYLRSTMQSKTEGYLSL